MRISELQSYTSLKKLEAAGFDITKSLDGQQAIVCAKLLGSIGYASIWETTPLCYAAELGDVALIKDLCAHGANVNVRDDDGYSPLLLAVREGRAEAVKVLIELGADQTYSNTRSHRHKSPAYMLDEGRCTHGFFHTQYEKWIAGRDVNYDKTESYLQKPKIT